jgi:hypothetical protein
MIGSRPKPTSAENGKKGGRPKGAKNKSKNIIKEMGHD